VTPTHTLVTSFAVALFIAGSILPSVDAHASDVAVEADRYLITDRFEKGQLVHEAGDLVATASAGELEGTRSLLVLLANFRDTPQPALSPAEVDERVFTQIADFYRESSYGRMTFAGEVRGWYDIDTPSTNCNIRDVAQRAIDAADADVDFTHVQHLLVLAPFSSCSFAGRAYVVPLSFQTGEGRIRMGLAAVQSSVPTLLFVAHELGHQFYLGHSDFLLCGRESITPGCFVARYMDHYSVMGYGNSWFLPRHPNAIHKEYLGWLDSRSIQTVTQGGIYTVAPFEVADPGVTKAIKVPRGDGEFLYVEYRQPIGWDEGMDSMPFRDGAEPTNVFEGALFHIVQPPSTDNPGLGTFLIDASVSSEFGATDYATAALPVGGIFTDPDSGSQVTVLSRTPASIELRVGLSYDCGDPTTTVPEGAPEICGNRRDDNCDGFMDEGCMCGDYRCPDFPGASPGVVDYDDVNVFAPFLGSSFDRLETPYDPGFDLNCDGYIDGSDLVNIAFAMGRTCEPAPTRVCCRPR
jgi:M6 family metalloprotease-like protein